MLALMFAVLLGQLVSGTTDVSKVAPAGCAADTIALLQHEGVAEIRTAHAHRSYGQIDSDINGVSFSPNSVVGTNVSQSFPSLVAGTAATEGQLHGALSAEQTGVPDIVYITGPFIPEEIVKNNLEYVSPGTEFRYFNDEQMEASTKKVSDELVLVGVHGAYDAYRMLRPMAYRADIWRLMVLWETGGYYLDAEMALRAHISNFVDTKNSGAFAACLEDLQSRAWRVVGTAGGTAYWTGVLAARAKDPLVLGMIRLIISNVESRLYPDELPGAVLQVSGPGVLTRIMEDAKFSPNARCRFEHYKKPGDIDSGSYDDNGVEIVPDLVHSRVVTMNGEVLLDSLDDVHEKTVGGKDRGYQEIYRNHAVYCDERYIKTYKNHAEPVAPEDDPCTKKPVFVLLGDQYWSKTKAIKTDMFGTAPSASQQRRRRKPNAAVYSLKHKFEREALEREQAAPRWTAKGILWLKSHNAWDVYDNPEVDDALEMDVVSTQGKKEDVPKWMQVGFITELKSGTEEDEEDETDKEDEEDEEHREDADDDDDTNKSEYAPVIHGKVVQPQEIVDTEWEWTTKGIALLKEQNAWESYGSPAIGDDVDMLVVKMRGITDDVTEWYREGLIKEKGEKEFAAKDKP
jgi:hypothetical protein